MRGVFVCGIRLSVAPSLLGGSFFGSAMSRERAARCRNACRAASALQRRRLRRYRGGMSNETRLPLRLRLRLLTAAGAVLAALAVALSAYAAHAMQGDGRASLYTAAILAFGHGIALAALAPRAFSRMGAFALVGLLLGTLLFSGSLAYRQMAGVSLGLAPFGGSLMILSWLLYAADALRR